MPRWAADGEHTSFRPGQPWLDGAGAHINAHGYCILKHDDLAGFEFDRRAGQTP